MDLLQTIQQALVGNSDLPLSICGQVQELRAVSTGGGSLSSILRSDNLVKDKMQNFKPSGIFASKDVSDLKPTRLEKQFKLHADSVAYMNDDKYDEAYGNLLSLLNLGEEVCFAPTLVNYYTAAIGTGRIEDSIDVLERLVAIIKWKLHSTSKECELFADKYRAGNDHIKAILFYQIAGSLYTTTKESEEIVNCLQGCILGMKISAAELIKERPDLRCIVTPYIVPALRKIYNKICSIDSSQPTTMILIQALCLHHIETTELIAEDPTLRVATLKEEVALFEDKFGYNAKRYKVYSAALNNLGAVLLGMQKPFEARDALNRAIEARHGAEDYDTEEERQKDLEMTSRALLEVDEMIKCNPE